LFAEIVLILAHADRLGINLDQLGERVLKSTTAVNSKNRP
jgi:hypothetical protein